MRKNWLVTALALLGFCLPALSQDTLQQAKELYRQEKFAQALELYQKELKNHTNDPFLYYNIGNCYFKMGNKGLASANYYRAFMREPRDLDIRHNLALVRASSGEGFVPSGVPEIVHRIYFGLSLAELTGLVFVLFWLSCLTGCFWLLKRKGAKVLLLACVLTACTAGWWYTRAKWEHRALAVVLTPVAEIRSGPGTNFPASASITQGHLLTVQDENADWYEVVASSQGLRGWVEKSALERI